jgi:hypothetical protein
MSNAGSESVNDEKSSESLPDLYRLLALTPLEADVKAIELALSAMQAKIDAAPKSDIKLAQRAAKVVALGKKNLLEPSRKLAYDRAWTKSFGAPEPVAPVASQPAPTLEKSPELEWDLTELETYLPVEDPRSPFDLGGFLRSSACLPESNPTADYDKLQSFLGGTATAVLAAPESISAAAFMSGYAPARYDLNNAVESSEDAGLFAAPKLAGAATRLAPGEIARQIRRKRSRSMLLSVGGLVAVIAAAFGVLFYLVSDPKKPAQDASQLAIAPLRTDPKPQLVKAPELPVAPAIPQGSGLPRVRGLDGSSDAAPFDMQAGMNPDSNPDAIPGANPTGLPAAEPAKPAPAPSPDPTAPAVPPVTMEPVPESEPAMPPPQADPVLTDDEKSTWQKSMKELLKTLGAQEFAKAKARLAEVEVEARTQLQKQQLMRLAAVARLTEEFHGFLVDAIAGLDAAETFTIGRSTPVSFIEGSPTEIAVKIGGRPQRLKLTELPTGLAMGLVDLQMDTAHPTSLARKAAFAIVHPKTNALAIKVAREQMAQAAVAGAVAADMPTVFDEDYSLSK